jgi:hypothetical protein
MHINRAAVTAKRDEDSDSDPKTLLKRHTAAGHRLFEELTEEDQKKYEQQAEAINAELLKAPKPDDIYGCIVMPFSHPPRLTRITLPDPRQSFLWQQRRPSSPYVDMGGAVTAIRSSGSSVLTAERMIQLRLSSKTFLLDKI